MQAISYFITYYAKRVVYLFRLHVLRETIVVSHSQWLKADGDRTLRFDYPLNDESVVFDVGGFMGEWSAEIIKRYDPYVHIFEPLPEYYDGIKKKFAKNPKVKVYGFGLGGETKQEEIALIGDATSTYKAGARTQNVEIKSIDEFMR